VSKKHEPWDQHPDGRPWTKAEMDHMDWTGEPYDVPPVPWTHCCQGTGFADFAAVPCPNPSCPTKRTGETS
jgi:hypothetical protein